SMSNLSIQQGTHSLFFPGGTRSRSGMTENKLKLGLLGTAIEAQRAICQKKLDNKVFIVPLILDYHFVLEARFLIEEYLQSLGKEKYMSIRDFSKSKRKLLKFLFQYYNRSSEIVMSFGQPFDVLGNFVRADGSSVDEHDRTVDIADYFSLDGEVTQNLQRENVYTKLLSDRIVERFYKDNVVLTSHLVAFTAFQILLKDHPELDIFGVMKLPFEDFEVSMPRFRSQVIVVLRQLKKMEASGNIRLSEPLSWDLDDMIKDGIEKLGLYHDKKPLKLTKDNFVTSENFKLLFYYHNRLENYGLDKLIRRRTRLATIVS
ncbi:MAG: glycerol acyltransferase, partial [Saprospiraceae bacterium]|nr:glycerol acyltransferase [Saprospiraceae bacterium]